MNPRARSLAGLLGVLAVSLIVAQCSIPRAHLWMELSSSGEEPPGYGMYTYVLMNEDPVRGTGAWDRYNSLAAAITASTPEADELASDFPRAEFNLFLLPVRAETAAPTGEQAGSGFDLNARLSRRLLTNVVLTTADSGFRQRLTTHPGPFLVSSSVPLGELAGDQADLLYVDLSTMNPAAMNDVVAVYKRRLTAGGVEGVERFRSFRLALLDLLTDIDDHVQLVQVAVASLREER